MFKDTGKVRGKVSLTWSQNKKFQERVGEPAA
jgi:hypothetical protein